MSTMAAVHAVLEHKQAILEMVVLHKLTERGRILPGEPLAVIKMEVGQFKSEELYRFQCYG